MSKVKVKIKPKLRKEQYLEKGLWIITSELRGAVISVMEVINPYEIEWSTIIRESKEYYVELNAGNLGTIIVGKHSVLYVSENGEDDHFEKVFERVIDEIKFFYGDGYLPVNMYMKKIEEEKGIIYNVEQLGKR